MLPKFSTLLWIIFTAHGIALLFNGNIRNLFYSSFSYLSPISNKLTQDLAEISRFIIALQLIPTVFIRGPFMRILSISAMILYAIINYNPFFFKIEQRGLWLLGYTFLVLLSIKVVIKDIIKEPIIIKPGQTQIKVDSGSKKNKSE